MGADCPLIRGSGVGELILYALLIEVCPASGQSGEACDALVALYAWFTEGLDAPDLVAVRALLEPATRA